MDSIVQETPTLNINDYVRRLAQHIHRTHMPTSVNLKSFNPRPRYHRPDRLVQLRGYTGLLCVDRPDYSVIQLQQSGVVLRVNTTYYMFSCPDVQILTNLKDPYVQSYCRTTGDARWQSWSEAQSALIDQALLEKRLKELDL